MRVRVDEAAKFFRKQWAMNADKCACKGGKGFADGPKVKAIKVL
jgi:hypothetical protein